MSEFQPLALLLKEHKSERVLSALLRDLMMVTPKEVCTFLMIKEWKLRQMRKLGTGPSYVKIGGTLYYPLADLIRWVNSRKYRHEAQEHLEAEKSKLQDIKESLQKAEQLRLSLFKERRALLLKEEII